jgi:hypothetical protein
VFSGFNLVDGRLGRTSSVNGAEVEWNGAIQSIVTGEGHHDTGLPDS